jgi:protein-glutamine gamma-glutamyltransferase
MVEHCEAKKDEVPWKGNMECLGDEVKYSVVMEPTNQNWIFSLTLPEAESSGRVGLVRDFRFYSLQVINAKLRYELTSHPDSRMDITLSDFWRY